MSKTSVSNETSDLLCVWIEPWGTDHWLCPGEEFTVVTQDTAVEAPFNLVVHDQGISVFVNSGFDAEVIDRDGNPAPCGHQRPAGFDADSRWETRWTSGRIAAGRSGARPDAWPAL